MTTPSVDRYKDLHAELKIPQMTPSALATYFNHFGQTFPKKAESLYHEGFIVYIRVCEDNSIFYFKSECRAEMKVRVTYKVDVCLDGFGVVKECQCECGAGMGPHAHCKHVATLLHGIMEFSASGKFVTDLTCTQQLQTFHHSKKHHGSPVKSENLTIPVNRDLDFDPRPLEFRQTAGYGEVVRNTCINGTMAGASMMQLYAPANPRAYILDHDYWSQENPYDRFLKSIGVLSLAQDEINVIEAKTRGQAASAVWRQERCKRLSASNFGTICKSTERRDAMKLVYSLMTFKEINSASLRHGRSYESVAVKKYEEITNTETVTCGIFVSHSHPHLCATPDRLIKPDGILEVKCPFASRDQAISPATVPYLELKNDHLELKKTHSYYYQVQGQIFCCNAKYVDFVVYTSVDIKIIRITRDDIFIQDMLEKLNNFFNTYFRDELIEKFMFKNYFKY
jgi:hypothetical protein